MIQDIGNRTFDNSFRSCHADADDRALAFDCWSCLMGPGGDCVISAGTACAAFGIGLDELVFAFAIDEMRFFIVPTWNCGTGEPEKLETAGLSYESIHQVFDLDDNTLRFACATGLHLSRWYSTNRYCGRCGHDMLAAQNERALLCPACGNHLYPRINPAVIVAVIDGDRILMTRYANRPYVNRALIAGFCEIGETAEDTVVREVYEETGVCVKNIRYVSNQPWGMSGDLLLGFVAELDGSDEIRIDPEELKSAEWVRREDIYEEEDNISLTRSLVMMFKRGEL